VSFVRDPRVHLELVCRCRLGLSRLKVDVDAGDLMLRVDPGTRGYVHPFPSPMPSTYYGSGHGIFYGVERCERCTRPRRRISHDELLDAVADRLSHGGREIVVV
jgi:hypothetical protein